MSGLHMASWTSKSQFTVENVTLVIANFSCNPSGHAAAHASRVQAIAAKMAAGAKPGAPAPAVPAALASTPPIPLHGQLAVYPTTAMSAGLPATPALETVPFTVPDIDALPAATGLLAQIYAALKLQPAYASATLT